MLRTAIRWCCVDLGTHDGRHIRRRATSNQLRFQPEGIALSLDSVKKPVLGHALETSFSAVPLPKKAPAETLGGVAELNEADLDGVATEAAAHGAHAADGG
jgi:hypothetical protein